MEDKKTSKKLVIVSVLIAVILTSVGVALVTLYGIVLLIQILVLP